VEENILLAFLLTLFAGLATSVGSVLALLAKRTNTRALSIALGFSAGVMIYVSLVEILPKGRDALAEEMSLEAAGWITLVSFLAGIALIAIIDRLVPSYENPHEAHRIEELAEPASVAEVRQRALLRMGVMSAIAIGIHNFPEGLATFVAALQDTTLGVTIAVAIAVHNVPEGVAVSVPIYYATGSRRRAFLYSSLSGLAEPIGAIVGYVFLRAFLGDLTMGLLFGMVAGIMVYVSLDELLPTAREYGEHHLAMGGLVAGMAVMGISLLLFM
jgi:ZIP family zinc transporter